MESRNKLKRGDRVRISSSLKDHHDYSKEKGFFGHHIGDIGLVIDEQKHNPDTYFVEVEGRTSTSYHAPYVVYKRKELELLDSAEKPIVDNYKIF